MPKYPARELDVLNRSSDILVRAIKLREHAGVVGETDQVSNRRVERAFVLLAKSNPDIMTWLFNRLHAGLSLKKGQRT